MAYPETYKYTREHEWIAVEGTTGAVGITDYAQHSLGDIVFVELPRVGDVLEAGKIFGSIESVKSVSDLYSPVAGQVVDINDTLTTSPETINSDANATWIVKIELSDTSEVDGLMDSTAYEAFTSEETGQ